MIWRKIVPIGITLEARDGQALWRLKVLRIIPPQHGDARFVSKLGMALVYIVRIRGWVGQASSM